MLPRIKNPLVVIALRSVLPAAIFVWAVSLFFPATAAQHAQVFLTLCAVFLGVEVAFWAFGITPQFTPFSWPKTRRRILRLSMLVFALITLQ